MYGYAHALQRACPMPIFCWRATVSCAALWKPNCSHCNLAGRFHLLGWQRDIPSLLHASDILVLTSRWEGLPRVIPQAMCAGLPVVVTRADGSPEAVRQGQTGFVFEPGDIAGIAEKTVSLLENPEQAQRMGKAAQALVAEFDTYKMVAEQESLYCGQVKKIS